jgi:hypothetical protein
VTLESVEVVEVESEIKQVSDAAIEISTKTTTDPARPIADATVIIKAYERGTKNQITGIQGESSFTQLIATTNRDGLVNVTLPNYPEHSAIDLVVQVQKDGFVTIEKDLKNIRTGSRVPVSFVLNTEQLEVQLVNRQDDSSTEFGSASAQSVNASTPSVSFALVKNRFGEYAVMNGEAAAQAMSSGDGEIQVEVDIPVSRIEDGVTALTAAIRGFNPSEAADSQSFPGSFEGFGEEDDFDSNHRSHNRESDVAAWKYINKKDQGVVDRVKEKCVPTVIHSTAILP